MMRCGAVGLIFLAGAIFVIGAIAVAIPLWGHFRNRVVQETGNFGPWTLCRDIDYGRRSCGPRVVQFKPLFVVYAAGVCAAMGVTALGAYGLMSVFYLSLTCSPQSSYRRYRIHILVVKLILSLMAALMTIAAVGLFAIQGDDLENGYIITVGFSFYMEIVVALFSVILLLLTIGEYVSFRKGGPMEDDFTDPSRTEIGMKTVITNPSAYNSFGRKVQSSSADEEDNCVDLFLAKEGRRARRASEERYFEGAFGRNKLISRPGGPRRQY